ncbi:DnaD domain-containing protein [Anaeromicrobium sediminis]|uniref:Primosomal replication protein N n=1 Tax=Anaeromicrobium sediminis TaxID=1478221 RepID=A0A267MI63_9FIRM|nr:DnaD domain protein [Anaeromicrobium sediminis]PAB58490.1 primosomal replication protein N [Anaeromicrobium sediminis]
MHFFKETTKIDLGDTSVENIFINDFMPMANGTHVKVYLLGYKYANDRDPSLSVNNQTIGRHLSIPLSDVMDAWDFWEKKGIIKKHFTSDDNPYDFTVEFLSLKQLYIDNNYKATNSVAEADEPVSGTYSCSAKDLLEAKKVPEINDMFYEVNQLLKRSLYPNEMKIVLEWIYNYSMDPDLIIRAFDYCVEKKNIKNINYVGAVIRNWYDNGITTGEKLDNYLEQTDTKFSQYKRVFKALGFGHRPPSENEKRIMDVWFNEWNFSMELVLKACENSSKTSNPNINFINSILKGWKQDKINTIDEVNAKEAAHKEKGAVNKAPVKKGFSNNRFHNFKQRTDKYSSDELEKLVRRKR